MHRFKTINIKKIKVPIIFKMALPNRNKMSDKYFYYLSCGDLSKCSEIVLDEEYNLLDGYTSYIIACLEHIKRVKVKIMIEE